MPSLTDRLVALGVKIGATGLPKPPVVQENTIDKVLSGSTLTTHYGEVFHVEERISVEEYYGNVLLKPSNLPKVLAQWADSPSLTDHPPETFVFLDIETTGLGLGSGVLAFLVGVGKYAEGQFHIDQYFLRDPGDEAPLLAAITSYAHGHHVLVTFNGKAFDEPILNNRFIINGMVSPFKQSIHIDLLQLARKLWRMRLPSRSLLTLEGQILEVQRGQEDIPGWVIPQLYQDYLLTRDARLIKSVFYHNAKDILAMAALLAHSGQLLVDPLNNRKTHVLDLVGIGLLHEATGRDHDAIQIYRHALKSDLPDGPYRFAHKHLRTLLKKVGKWQECIELWQEAANQGEIDAYIELAKYYEHRARDISTALQWTHQAITKCSAMPDSLVYLDELNHRLARLVRKSS